MYGRLLVTLAPATLVHWRLSRAADTIGSRGLGLEPVVDEGDRCVWDRAVNDAARRLGCDWR